MHIGKHTIEETEKLRHRYNWVAWNAASFGRAAEWYKEATLMCPEKYKEGSDMEFARMAMKLYEEIWQLDPECAKMIGSSWAYDIAKMLDTLGKEGKRYLNML